jgi:hypothetical protein
VTLYLDEGGEQQMLVHWDYERDPQNEYPPAHVQVDGSAPPFQRMCELARTRLRNECSDKELRELHFPVGARRFRPSLEDIIEFLIVEKLVEYRHGWRSVIDTHREKWEDLQLRAAVRRHPDIAVEQLRQDGQLP